MKKVLLIAAMFAAGYGGGFVYFLMTPGSGSPEPIYVVKGMPFRDVTRALIQERIITHALHFRVLAAVLGMTRHVEAGEYDFSRPLRPLRVLTMLTRGDVKKYFVTIPEGETIRGIAAAIEEAGMGDARDILERARDTALVRTLKLEGATLEGYLFPETYELTWGMSTDDILMTFIRRYRQVFTAEMEKKAAGIGMSPYQVLILASIIEKEAKRPEERPLISAAFHNRLKRGMPLQADPTLIYGLGEIEGRLRKVHLQTDTPYNTYLHKGLPPGPISNPGLPSILAALNPAPVSYLYFVARNDGSHVFSTNLADHNKFVNMYQRSHRARKGS